jgi:hypothetical protein
MKQNQDRFTLEENIMEVWQTSNDIRLIVEQFQEPYHPKQHSALLVKLFTSLSGLEEIHSLRCQKLMDTFEALLHEDQQDSIFSQYNWTDQPSTSTVDVDTIADKVSENYQSEKA